MRNKKVNVLLSIMLVMSLLLGGVTNFHDSNAAKKMSINKKKLTLEVGKTYQLKIKGVKKVTWKSSNKKIASVSKKGLVKAVRKGKATVSGTAGKKTYKCVVTVNKVTPTPIATEQPTPTPTPDPVSLLKKIAEEHIKSYVTDDRTMALENYFNKKWTLYYFFASKEYSYDVKTTNSLVSPYEGTITYNLIRCDSIDYDTELQALNEGKNDIKNYLNDVHRHKYAFQDGEWVVIERKQYDHYKDKWYDCNVPRSFEVNAKKGCYEKKGSEYLLV